MATNFHTPPPADAADFDFKRPLYTPPQSSEDLDFNFSAPFTQHNILAGTNNVFISIWADPDASLDNGKFYAASTGVGATLSVVDMNNQVLHDFYSQTSKGAHDEVLANNDIEDINIVMRG